VSVRVAIIGAGVIGARRAESAARRGQLELVADIDGDRATALARKHGVRHTTQWEDGIADPAVGAVVVCTYNKLLAPVSIAALGAGKHVLCEKPMGRNFAEAKQIAEVAQNAGQIFKLGFTLRFHPAIRKAHQLSAAGEIGPLFHVSGAYGHGGRPGYAAEWRGNAELAGGGELLDQGVHLLDLARWFLGDLRVKSALAPRWYWDISPLEDNAFVLLAGAGDQVASLHASWTMWRNRFQFEAVGRDGYLRVDGLGGSYGTETLTVGKHTAEGVAPDEIVTTFPDPDRSFDADWSDFVAAIDSTRKPEVGADDGLAVMALVDDVYRVADKAAAAVSR
jgi:predicted dehydrogenase